jgi:hypothetical protein
MSDTESNNTRWHRVEDRRGRRVKDAPSPYDEDEYEPEECGWTARWLDVERRTAFPPVASLIKHSSCEPMEPKPLSPRVVEEHAAALKEIEDSSFALKGAEVKLKKSMKELEEAKAAASSVNKWSTTSKTASANCERLRGVVAEDQKLVDEMKKRLDAVKKGRAIILELVQAYEAHVDSYHAYKEMQARHVVEEQESEQMYSRELKKALCALSPPAPRVEPAPWQRALAATALY